MTSPLEGLRVLLTRPTSGASDEWARVLSTAGAAVIAYPTIDILPPPSWDALDSALAQADRYDWIIFTSQSAVSFTASRLRGGSFPAHWGPRVAAVGAETARALEQLGAVVDVVPSDQRQEGLLERFRDLAPGTRLLLPQSSSGRAALTEALRARGCHVDVVSAYQTAPRRPLPPLPAFDVAIFASPSALRPFVEQHGLGALATKIVAVIGPTTATEAVSHGLRPVAAVEPNIDALISAIVRERSSQGGH